MSVRVKFIVKNIKGLLIPSILLCVFSACYKYYFEMKGGLPSDESWRSLVYWLIDGGPWFVIAMFWAKMIYWLIDKFGIQRQFFACGFVYLVGLILHKFEVHNYQWHQHAFLMVPYLWIGALYRKNIEQWEK